MQKMSYSFSVKETVKYNLNYKVENKASIYIPLISLLEWIGDIHLEDVKTLITRLGNTKNSDLSPEGIKIKEHILRLKEWEDNSISASIVKVDKFLRNIMDLI